MSDSVAMSERFLEFVMSAADAASVPDGHEAIVISPWFTPPDPPDPSVRGVSEFEIEILRSADVVTMSLKALDAWASGTDLPAHFTLDGTSWWQRVRMTLRWDVYELFLWRLIIGRMLAEPGTAAVDGIVVPAERPLLGVAARALGLAVQARPEARAAASTTPVTTVRRQADGRRRSHHLGRVLWRLARLGLPVRRAEWIPDPLRVDLLERRVRRLSTLRPVVALRWAGAYQVTGRGADARAGDPFLDPATERLQASGIPVAIVELGRSHRKAADWRSIVADERRIPWTFIHELWPADGLAGADPTPTAGSIAALEPPPLLVDGCDLGPAVLGLVGRYGGDWLDERRQTTATAGQFLDMLRPRAVLLDREGTRLTWIAAAQERGIPVVSTQHGMIYPDNPEFIHPHIEHERRPDITCVFGRYERDLLVRDGGFPEDAVEVIGSPRVPDTNLPDRSPATRAAVRASLGVETSARMLVVSAAHGAIGETLTAAMLATVLDGPLPGVHVVVKVHPQDHEPADFAGFLRGRAAAGGYPAPAVSIVRDIDLVDLLTAADAHLGQASTVLTDSVAAGTPTMVAASLAHSDLIGHVAAGVATPVRSAADVRAFMDAPVTPEAAVREAFLRAHFEPGDAAARLAEVVLAVAETGRTA